MCNVISDQCEAYINLNNGNYGIPTDQKLENDMYIVMENDTGWVKFRRKEKTINHSEFHIDLELKDTWDPHASTSKKDKAIQVKFKRKRK